MRPQATGTFRLAFRPPRDGQYYCQVGGTCGEKHPGQQSRQARGVLVRSLGPERSSSTSVCALVGGSARLHNLTGAAAAFSPPPSSYKRQWHTCLHQPLTALALHPACLAAMCASADPAAAVERESHAQLPAGARPPGGAALDVCPAGEGRAQQRHQRIGLAGKLRLQCVAVAWFGACKLCSWFDAPLSLL